jgi:hypothetical protein
MSRKNGKKGFQKLSNDNMALMDHGSGSEIELLDLTQLDNGHIMSMDENSKRKDNRCCCQCIIAFYMFILTLSLAVVALFVLYTAYNVHLLTEQTNTMKDEIDKLKTSLNEIISDHRKDSKVHLSEIMSLNSSVKTMAKSMDAMTGSMNQLENKMASVEISSKLMTNKWVCCVGVVSSNNSHSHLDICCRQQYD